MHAKINIAINNNDRFHKLFSFGNLIIKLLIFHIKVQNVLMYGTYNQFIFKSIIANIHLEISHPLKILISRI